MQYSAFMRKLTKNEQQLLVFGYIRTKCSCIIYIPIEIIKLIRTHIASLNNVYHWKFDHNFLDSLFKSKSSNYTVQIPSFHINGIVFKCKIHITNHARDNEKMINISIGIQQLPYSSTSVTIYCQFDCTSTQIKYKNADITDYTHWKSVHTFDAVNKYSCQWNKSQMAISECQHANELDFCCFIDILKIKYRKQEPFIKCISIKKECEFIWNISKIHSEFNQLQKCRFRKLFSSQIFNKIFLLECYRNDEIVYIAIKLCGMPFGVCKFKADIIIKNNLTPQKLTGIHSFSYAQCI
eukprot:443301_1